MHTTSRQNIDHTFLSDQEVFYTIGVGTGATAAQLLQLANEDIKDGYITLHVGPKQIRRTFRLPEDVTEALKGRTGRLFDAVPDGIVIKDFLPMTMKRYHEETGDLAYPIHLMGLNNEDAARRIIG